MARVLIGNFKGPEGPRGEQGPQGEQGPKGEQGPPGNFDDVEVGANIIPLGKGDWVKHEQYSASTGNPTHSTERHRSKDKVSVEKGSEYTFHYNATHPNFSGLRIYVWDNGTFVDSHGISSSGTTITIQGDEVGFTLYTNDTNYIPFDGFEGVRIKGEYGNTPTKIFESDFKQDMSIGNLRNTAFFDGSFTGSTTGGVVDTEPIPLNHNESQGITHDGHTLTLQPGFYIYGCNMMLPSSTDFTFAVDVELNGSIKQRYVSTPTDRAISFVGMLVVESESTLVFKGGTGASVDEISFDAANNNKMFVKKI